MQKLNLQDSARLIKAKKRDNSYLDTPQETSATSVVLHLLIGVDIVFIK